MHFNHSRKNRTRAFFFFFLNVYLFRRRLLKTKFPAVSSHLRRQAMLTSRTQTHRRLIAELQHIPSPIPETTRPKAQELQCSLAASYQSGVYYICFPATKNHKFAPRRTLESVQLKRSKRTNGCFSLLFSLWKLNGKHL